MIEINEILILYVQYLLKKYETNTVLSYSRHVRELIVFLSEKKMTFENLNTDVVTMYLENIANLSRNSYNAYCTSLSMFSEFLVIKDIIKSNPFLNKRLPRKNIKKVKATVDDINKFIKVIDKKKINVRAAYYVVLSTGCRIGEVSGLRRDDFIVDNNRLLINIKNAKWNSNRIVPFYNAEYAKIVYDFIKNLSNNFCPFPPVRTLQWYPEFYGKRIGFHVTPHSLRHYFAYSMILQGYNINYVQTNLGHTSINMSNYYTIPAQQDLILSAPKFI